MCVKQIIQNKNSLNDGPSNNHELYVGGVVSEPFPDIYGEDCAAAIEDGGQGRDEGRHHYGQHEAAQSRGHQLQHERGEGDVGAAGPALADPLALVWVRAGYSVCEKGGKPISIISSPLKHNKYITFVHKIQFLH